MKIAVVGTGYVGLVSGACFAEMGLDITCVDVDRKKIDALNNGLIPIYEPGLEELVKRNVEEGRLHFTTELTDCLDKVEVVFSAVGTPPDEDGSADLKYVLEVARTFGRNIKKYTVLVTKSTVPVGTAQKVKAVIREEIDKRGCKIPFDVASNPEFLKEGAAIKDFMSPDRVVVGVESERARKLMTRLYRPFLINNFRVLFMDIPSAEMTKYAANAMLATRISFMNEIANLCDLVGFAEMGLDITCVDVDRKKIDALNNGLIPIYEPGLEELVKRNVEEGRLHFTTELTDCLDKVEVVFSAVGTPPDEDGSADLKYVLEVARTFGRNIKKYTVLVTKSTVPVGTAQKVKAVIREEIDKRGCKIPFDVASNPEFLKEGAAIKDFMSPDRVVVGVESERARKLMTRLYRPFLINNFRVLFMDIPSAEMTKYAANAMLATRISFMNEIANLCDLVGANVEMVRKGIGSDARIGSKFLYPGCGYGGSCFPKDVKALARTAQENGYTMQVIEAVERVNEGQKSILFGKLQRALGDLHGKTIAIWGLAFKPETDDMREAPALVVIDLLRKAGATVRVYDPVAMEEGRRRIGDEGVHYAGSMYEAAKGADAIALVTEWKQFRMPDWAQLLTLMRDNILVDGRNIFDKEEVLNAGLRYYGIGK